MIRIGLFLVSILSIAICVLSRIYNPGYFSVIFSPIVIPAFITHLIYQYKARDLLDFALGKFIALTGAINFCFISSSVLMPDGVSHGPKAVFSRIKDPPFEMAYMAVGLFILGGIFLYVYIALYKKIRQREK